MTVYFVQARTLGQIKIGYTEGPLSKRLEALRCGCPDVLDVLALIDGGKREEQALHRRFAEAHHRGEWFNPTPELLALIEANKRRIWAICCECEQEIPGEAWKPSTEFFCPDCRVWGPVE